MTRQATPDLLGEPIPSEDPSLEAMLGSAQRIATVLIRLDGGTQPRAGIDQGMVDDYANDMANGAVFPPVELVYDGTDYWLWDGFHRFHAFRRDGDRAIPANVRQGTRRDAVLLSVGANATHGLRRTNADKRRSVLALLEDEEWSQWSDREIARRCAVGHAFVSNMRADLPTVHDGQSVERRGADGRVINVANIGQRPAAPALASQEATWLTADEVLVQLDQWSDQFEEPDQALARLHDEASEGAGNTLDDWTNWVTGKWSLSRLLKALAALRLLPDDDEEHKPETKPWEPPDTAKWVEPEPRPMAHVGQNSGNNEWYTPAEYIEAARAVMGGIDLDPASTEFANTVVQASKFYTVDDNGLLYDWHGRVFMNPPYSQPAINDFANRLAEEYRAGRVTVAIVLVNNATETWWFQTLIDCASAVCFPSGRVKFWSPDRVAAPLQGQAIIYLGRDPDAFICRFIGFGWCAEVARC